MDTTPVGIDYPIGVVSIILIGLVGSGIVYLLLNLRVVLALTVIAFVILLLIGLAHGMEVQQALLPALAIWVGGGYTALIVWKARRE